MNYTYRDLLERINRTGNLVNPRGTETKELLNAGLEVPLGILPRRQGLVRALGYMELCQWVAGTFDLGAIRRVAPGARLELFTQEMAYGPRTMWPDLDETCVPYTWNNQLDFITRELQADPSSRRAQLILGRPEDAEDPGNRPCTTSVQFLVRDGAMHVTVNLRSWDLWWGAPYDLVMYSGIGMMMARVLDLGLGNLHVNAASAHVYRPHWGQGIGRGDYGYDVLNFEAGLPSTWPLLRTWARHRVIDPQWISGPPVGLVEGNSQVWSSGHSATVVG